MSTPDQTKDSISVSFKIRRNVDYLTITTPMGKLFKIAYGSIYIYLVVSFISIRDYPRLYSDQLLAIIHNKTLQFCMCEKISQSLLDMKDNIASFWSQT